VLLTWWSNTHTHTHTHLLVYTECYQLVLCSVLCVSHCVTCFDQVDQVVLQQAGCGHKEYCTRVMHMPVLIDCIACPLSLRPGMFRVVCFSLACLLLSCGCPGLLGRVMLGSRVWCSGLPVCLTLCVVVGLRSCVAVAFWCYRAPRVT